MIETGSMLFKGRRCGSLTLYISHSTFAWAAEIPGKNTLEDAILDARFKLDEVIASRSPVEAEIAFLTQWLQLAEMPEVTTPLAALEIPPVDTPIKDDNRLTQGLQIAFSTIEEVPEIKADDLYNSNTIAEEIPEINEPLTRK